MAATLVQSVQKLRAHGVVPGVAAGIRQQAESLTEKLVEAAVQAVPAYTASGNPDVLPELETHLAAHVDALSGTLAGQPPGDLGFVRDHARRRAGQKFPLEAVLATFRSLHAVLTPAVRDAALAAADATAQVPRVVAAVAEFTGAYANAIGTLLTAEYVSQTRALAEAEGDRRTELLRMLLGGYDESDSRAAELLRRAGYLEQRQSFCVVVARSVDPREMENPARAQRMVDAVGEVVRNLPIRVLIGMHENLVTLVLSGTRRQSGWTAPQSLLAERVHPHLRTIGPAALIGVSADAPSTSHIPNALMQAKLALDIATVGERVMPYARIPFRRLLVAVAADQVRAAMPDWLADFAAADEKARGSLSETLRAYADADMNVLRTAKQLALHPNTIYARMQRIEDLTGRNPLSYHALTELLLATECAATNYTVH